MTMANVIEAVQKPALVIAHNKTLAAQLCNEFRSYFPRNAVEYFVSYYDYYQPEAYVPSTDPYIEKDSAINEEIDRLRHSATTALLARRDVLIVAQVSCIYGLGSPQTYDETHPHAAQGRAHRSRQLLRKLVDDPVHAQRHRARARHVPRPGRRRSRSSPPTRRRPTGSSCSATRSSSSSEFDPLTGEVSRRTSSTSGSGPASHYNVREGDDRGLASPRSGAS